MLGRFYNTMRDLQVLVVCSDSRNLREAIMKVVIYLTDLGNTFSNYQLTGVEESY